MAAGSLRRRCRGDPRSPWDALVRAVGPRRGSACRRRRGRVSGAAESAPPTAIPDLLAIAQRRGCWCRATPVRCTSPPPSVRQSWRCSDPPRRAQRSLVGRRLLSREPSCACHYERRCRRRRLHRRHHCREVVRPSSGASRRSVRAMKERSPRAWCEGGSRSASSRGAALVLAQPTWPFWRVGPAVALAGEVLRVWAAGHLEKSREVTSSGPYRFTRHPLYVGLGDHCARRGHRGPQRRGRDHWRGLYRRDDPRRHPGRGSIPAADVWRDV